MITTLACGCCCLSVVIVVGVMAVLGIRGRSGASGGVGDTPDAPARGSSTNARLTFMEEPLPNTPEAATVQLRPLPKSVPLTGQNVARTASPAPATPAPASPPTAPPTLTKPPTPAGPRVVAPSPTFIPPADDEV